MRLGIRATAFDSHGFIDPLTVQVHDLDTGEPIDNWRKIRLTVWRESHCPEVVIEMWPAEIAVEGHAEISGAT